MTTPALYQALLGFTLILSSSFPSLSEPLFHPAFPPNPRLDRAFLALQAWKQSILSDPHNLTGDWWGPDVCSYTGVFCAPALDDPRITTVAGVDLNHGDIAGILPEQLGLLSDLTLIHINSNRFSGFIPFSFCELKLLFELDVSNNLLSGEFPSVVLRLPSLKYLDIRFNNFHGKVPSNVFDLPLDALFINDNNFSLSIPPNIGNSPVSVLVLANNQITGSIPSSIGNMADTLNELILINVGLTSCLPSEIGLLKELTVLDVSHNRLVGPLPEAVARLEKLEQLNVAHNELSGKISGHVCDLPRLQNFTFSGNYFYSEPVECTRIKTTNDDGNCIRNRINQRSEKECVKILSNPVGCSK